MSAPVRSALRALALGAMLLPAVAPAQSPSPPGGIYTCIDPNGRRLTSDRPIPEGARVGQASPVAED